MLHLFFFYYTCLRPIWANNCSQNSPLSERNTCGLFTLWGFYWPWLVPENQLFRYFKIRNKKWILFLFPTMCYKIFLILQIWVLNVEFMQINNGLLWYIGTKMTNMLFDRALIMQHGSRHVGMSPACVDSVCTLTQCTYRIICFQQNHTKHPAITWNSLTEIYMNQRTMHV